MRRLIYGWMLRLPVRIGSSALGLIGFAGNVWPEWVKTMLGSALAAEHIRLIGGILMLITILYFALLWGMKPSGEAAQAPGKIFSGPTTVHNHYYPTLAEKLEPSLPESPDQPEPPPPIAGQVNATEEDDTLVATGALGLHGFYVGRIVVSAGRVSTEHLLEVAIFVYNGTDSAIHVSDVSGRIRAGTGNIRDLATLPAPRSQGLPKAKPGEEFMVVLIQNLSLAQSEAFLKAFEESQVSLDLRELRIVVAADDNPDQTASLPLWDGVNLRRRDDIVSIRNRIISVGVAVGTSSASAVGIAVTKEKPEKPNG